jgi:anti-sigma factor RsiW
MSHQWTDQLSAYLDHELDPTERARVAAHLAECADCRRVLEDLGRITGAARAYQGEPPAKDGWPGILRAIEADRVIALPVRPADRRGLGWRHLIAAGLVMAAAGLSGGWYWFGRSAEAPPAVVAVPAPAPAPAGTLVVGLTSAAYDQAVAELQRTLADNRGQLDTATVRSVEQSLLIIDQAIAEARAAIQRDPANGYLNGRIAANMRTKLSLLRIATRAVVPEA